MYCLTRTSMALAVVATATSACVTIGPGVNSKEAESRSAVLARAQLWRAADVPSMDLKKGPGGPGAFPFRATVVCTYREKQFDGRSPKFACANGEDDLKVKHGGANGEVYGEVLATRLLWALGFGADRMYPVNLVCRGCPDRLGGTLLSSGEMRFDPAVIERKMTGSEWPAEDESGWSWKELDTPSAAGGAPRAQRDALKLLAVFLQHTDSKPQQQRIACLPSAREVSSDSCVLPFLLISDVGLTFGRANRVNANDTGGVNLVEWRQTPVWKEAAGCTGNLPKSLTGTLNDPVISEDGRRFLAGLLGELSDRQIDDLFEAARVHLRLRDPRDVSSGFATTAEWAAAFKDKRSQIATRRCA